MGPVSTQWRRWLIVPTRHVLEGNFKVANALMTCFQIHEKEMSFLKHHVFDKEWFLVFPQEKQRFQKPCVVVPGTLHKSCRGQRTKGALLSQEHMWATLPSKVKTLCKKLNNYLKRSLQSRLLQGCYRKMRILLVQETSVRNPVLQGWARPPAWVSACSYPFGY